MKKAHTVSGRIPMLDVARFFGMILVYYGHIIERIMYLENPAATTQYKFIYSFHMPFFFLLAGLTIAPEKTLLPVGKYVKRLVRSRLAPYFFFSILLALLTLVFSGWFVAVDFTKPGAYVQGSAATLLGFPVFNIPLWFMACLVSVEILHYTVGRFLNTVPKLLLAAAGFYVGGYYLTLKVNLLGGATYWLIHEALVVYPFYLLGVLMRRHDILLGVYRRWQLLLAGSLCLIAVVLTWNLNEGPFQMIQAVVIVLSGHGNIFLFPFTAIAGSLFLLLIAKSVGANKMMMYLGENAVIFFCLNGIFYHFLNGPFASWFVKNFSGGWEVVTGGSMAFTVASMAACLPLIWALNKFAPWLVGRRAKDL